MLTRVGGVEAGTRVMGVRSEEEEEGGWARRQEVMVSRDVMAPEKMWILGIERRVGFCEANLAVERM